MWSVSGIRQSDRLISGANPSSKQSRGNGLIVVNSATTTKNNKMADVSRFHGWDGNG